MSRAARRLPSRETLTIDGPAVRVGDVAMLAGFSKAKLMADAKAGELTLTWKRCGTQRWAFVERAEAERYLDGLDCFTGNTARTA
jgi:hypothetical protein